MAMWRVLRRLSKGFNRVIEPGTITRLEWIDEDGLRRLQEVGAITRLTAPPLEKIWPLRSKKLAQAGITTVEQFLETDVDQLAEATGGKAATLAKWRNELEARWLRVPEPRKRR